MGWTPKWSDLLVINRPYNWLEARFVRNKDRFYKSDHRKYGYIAGACLYAATAAFGCKAYQNLSDDWHYADLSPTYSLIQFSMQSQQEDKSKHHLYWGLAAAFTFWAGDFALMYAARNRRYHKELGEKCQKADEIKPLSR